MDEGLESNFESQQAISQFWVQKTPELLGQAESQFAGRNLNDEERSAAATYVDEAGRRHREAENIDEYEGVYTGGENPREALENDSEGGLRVAEACEPEYEEFPIDDETSTCVFQSLVERNCFAGSRPVSVPGVDACLYYSLDFFQPGGTTCRTNYDRVYFQGRWTCRWDELEPNEPAWYTLYKEEEDDDEPVQLTGHGNASHCLEFSSPIPGTEAYGSPTTRHICYPVRNTCDAHVWTLVWWEGAPIPSWGRSSYPNREYGVYSPGETTHHCISIFDVYDRISRYCAFFSDRGGPCNW